MYCSKQRFAIIFILAAVVSLLFLLPLAISAITVVSADDRYWQNDLSENAWLYGVWGSSPSDVFVVGYDPWGQGSIILHYDGISWSPMNIGTSKRLSGSPSDVFAVGGNGTILHYDGISWSPMNIGTSKRLSDVWGNSSSDVFAVGGNGTILHYDGISWSPMSRAAPRRTLLVSGEVLLRMSSP